VHVLVQAVHVRELALLKLELLVGIALRSGVLVEAVIETVVDVGLDGQRFDGALRAHYSVGWAN
jgi:hypothetical protein